MLQQQQKILKKDPFFWTIHKRGKSCSLWPVGVYFYSRVNVEATGKAEAKFIIDLLKGKK